MSARAGTETPRQTTPRPTQRRTSIHFPLSERVLAVSIRDDKGKGRSAGNKGTKTICFRFLQTSFAGHFVAILVQIETRDHGFVTLSARNGAFRRRQE